MNPRTGPVPETLPLDIRRLVFEAYERFEGAWRVGGRPAIEPYLDGLGSDERTAVLHGLVALEVELRSERGDHPTVKEYRERFPSDLPVVTAAFAPPQGSTVSYGSIEAGAS